MRVLLFILAMALGTATLPALGSTPKNHLQELFRATEQQDTTHHCTSTLPNTLFFKRKAQGIYQEIEFMPTFMGGEKALKKHLQANFQYPPIPIEEGAENTIRFVVMEDGKIGHAFVQKTLNKEFDDEAIRVIHALPPFLPGAYYGEKSRTWFKATFHYTLKGNQPEVLIQISGLHTDYPIAAVLEPPTFPGGKSALRQYIDTHLIYPQSAIQKQIQGTVNVCYTLLKDGNITDVFVRQSLDPDCDAEAVRLVKSLPQYQLDNTQQNRYERIAVDIDIHFQRP